MASPQKENGWVSIATELYDQYIKFRMPREVRMICDFIIRKTYGFNKREDRIALSQFALALELKRPSVVRALKKALFMNLISRRANGNHWIYRFQKDFEAWKPLAAGLIISRRANASLAQGLHTKDNTTKDNIGNKKMDYEYEPDEEVTPRRKVERKLAKERGYRGEEVRPLLKWAENRMEHKFSNPIKQEASIKTMLYSGFSVEKIKNQWKDMENDKFWSKKGFDFGNVLNEISKHKPVNKRNPYLYADK